MTNNDIANHNELCATLTAEDGIARLTWEQHGAAFQSPAIEILAPGQMVAAWDSATPGTIRERRNGRYEVTFQDVSGALSYSAKQLRPWPLQ